MYNSKKILVIEDDDNIRGGLVDILEEEGFILCEAANGSLGVQIARREKPDLILCDVMMPGMDGYSVLRAIRQDQITALIPLIFLTAKVEKADLRKGMTLGADDYLTKPTTRDDLLNAILTRLQRQTTFNNYINN